MMNDESTDIQEIADDGDDDRHDGLDVDRDNDGDDYDTDAGEKRPC